jgi:hypothetical protein
MKCDEVANYRTATMSLLVLPNGARIHQVKLFDRSNLRAGNRTSDGLQLVAKAE